MNNHTKRKKKYGHSYEKQMPLVISEKLVTTFSIKIYIRERSIPYTFIWGTHQALKTFEQYYIVSTIVLLLTKHLYNKLIYLGIG